ncbi:hypothetical protein BC826DRAFT_737044 [Russula brevipes]|nr:hypothetical protein BC826DRAFT_737044 [Russula brevipes]
MQRALAFPISAACLLPCLRPSHLVPLLFASLVPWFLLLVRCSPLVLVRIPALILAHHLPPSAYRSLPPPVFLSTRYSHLPPPSSRSPPLALVSHLVSRRHMPRFPLLISLGIHRQVHRCRSNPLGQAQRSCSVLFNLFSCLSFIYSILLSNIVVPMRRPLMDPLLRMAGAHVHLAWAGECALADGLRTTVQGQA